MSTFDADDDEFLESHPLKVQKNKKIYDVDTFVTIQSVTHSES